MKQTLYDILGVERDASFEDVEVAYAKRFEVLKAETSWDSNRLVMLNEAREVLSDPTRRAAYDASLATAAQPQTRIAPVEIEEQPRSSGKWIILAVVVAAIAIWWATRDEAPPGEAASGLPAQDQAQFGAGDAGTTARGLEGGDSEAAEEGILIELEAPVARDEPEPSADDSNVAAVEADTSAEAEATTTAENAPDVAAGAPVAPKVDPIVGNWDCFEPVTGRTSKYGFAANGTLTIRHPDGEVQAFTYETVQGGINLVDSDPPRSLGVEELASRRLVLNVSGFGRRIVCSR